MLQLPSIFDPIRQAFQPVAMLTEQQALLAERERLQKIMDARIAYEGRLPDPLAVKPGENNDNVKYNLCGLFVDECASYLMGEELDFETERDGAESDTKRAPTDSPQDRYLDKFWKQNKKSILLNDIAVNGGICGHTFIKMKIERGLEYPRLIALDPATVSVLFEVDDYQKVIEYRILWHGIDPHTRKAVARRQRISPLNERSWQILDEIAIREGNWQILNTEVWPYPWSPMFHCQNLPAPNEFWGKSDLEEDIVHLNKSVNFTLSNISRILKWHAHPKTVGFGMSANQIDVSVSGMLCIPNTEAKISNLEMQSDLGSSIEFYRLLLEAAHALAHIPQVATGRTEDLGALSGIALKILYAPLVKMVKRKQILYGDMLCELNKRVLELGGFPDQEIVIHWPPIVPQNPKEEAESAMLLKEAGVSEATVLEQLGYDAQTEQEKKAQETETQMDVQRKMGDQILKQFDRGQMNG